MIPISFSCFDSHGNHYETRYNLHVNEPHSDSGMAYSIIPGVFLESRRVIMKSAWIHRFHKYNRMVKLYRKVTNRLKKK